MEMNRAMRRALKNNRPIPEGRVIPLPPMLDEWTIFDIPERIFLKLKHGEIEAINGTPIFFDMTGAACEVVPALSGWCYTWDRINDELELDLNLRPIKKVFNKLEAAMWLSPGDVIQAQAALDKIRSVFRVADRKAIKRIATEAQIAILMKDNLA